MRQVKCKAKGGVAEIMRSAIPYQVTAEQFVPGMEDGYAVATRSGLEVLVKKSKTADALLEKYKLLAYCVMTALGLIKVEMGDFVVTDNTTESKFVISKQAFERFYEILPEDKEETK